MCAERRIAMANKFVSPISLEKFAAYLDGNLPQNEIHEVSSLVERYEELQELINANEAIEETLEFNSFLNEDLPEDIASLDFEIPDIEGMEIFNDFEIENHEVDNPWEEDNGYSNNMQTNIENEMVEDNPFAGTELEESIEEEDQEDYEDPNF